MTNPRPEAGASAPTLPASLQPATDPWRRRHGLVWESARFSAYLRTVYGDDFARYVDSGPPTGGCDGAHHPGLACDYWGPCSGAAYTYAEHRRLRRAELERVA